MKKALTVLTAVFLAASLLLTGCVVRVEGSGNVETRQFAVTDFTRVKIGSAFDYTIVRSDKFAVNVTTDDNMFQHLMVKAEHGTLEVRLESTLGWFSIPQIGHSTRSVVITMPELDGLDISGASQGAVSGFGPVTSMDISLSGASQLTYPDLVSDKTDIDLSGASKLSLGGTGGDLGITASGASSVMVDSVSASKMDADLSGASRVDGDVTVAGNLIVGLSGASRSTLTGTAGALRLDANGASNGGMPDLTVTDADVTLSGASTAKLVVNSRLDMDLSGASSLYYTGQPSVGKISLSGASNVYHQDQ